MESVMNLSGIHPKGNKLLVKPQEIAETSAGGIIIPMQAQEKEEMAQMFGLVMEVGPMCWVDEVEKRCKVGDYIIFAKYSGEIFIGNDGVKYRLINAREVIATKDPIERDKEVRRV